MNEEPGQLEKLAGCRQEGAGQAGDEPPGKRRCRAGRRVDKGGQEDNRDQKQNAGTRQTRG